MFSNQTDVVTANITNNEVGDKPGTGVAGGVHLSGTYLSPDKSKYGHDRAAYISNGQESNDTSTSSTATIGDKLMGAGEIFSGKAMGDPEMTDIGKERMSKGSTHAHY
ncbi:hypothetical protein RhiLY_02380 [Ceratobasidium sp. AG-Ba]|nr:hypothetical protein RhiLY_02380 [Ceratobasidium sp. AG-Ba]